jgi:pimeloyl-ACP methyl ester carboxylesterase
MTTLGLATTTAMASVVATIVLIAGCATTAPADRQVESDKAGLTLKPCRVHKVKAKLRCGTIFVPENRDATGGRTIPLRIVVVPALARHPAAAPVFFLEGGPGDPATESAEFVVSQAPWLRQTQDVVLVDLRGTSKEHRLYCSPPAEDLQSHLHLLMIGEPNLARACRKELESMADLTQYTTPNFIKDLEEVRQALGYEQINLFGGSYGTRAALSYMKLHSEHVRTALLAAVVPFSLRLPLYFAATGQHAFDALVNDCEAEAACKAAYPDPRGDLAAVLQALREKPARVRISNPVTEAPAEVTLDADDFGAALYTLLYSMEVNRRVPLLLKQARAGDFKDLVEMAMLPPGKPNFGGIFLSVMCTEDMARIRPEELEREAQGSFLALKYLSGILTTCAEWPKGTLPNDYFEPFQTNVPTVMIAGKYDPASPPRFAEDAKQYLPNSVLLVTPEAHGYPKDDACFASVGRQLFQLGTLEGLDVSCVKGLRPEPFALPTAKSK